MNLSRRVLRLGLLVGLIGVLFFIAWRLFLGHYAASEPVAIGETPAPATFERAFPNLEFERPIFLTYPPDGTNRIAVVSQLGRVYIFHNDPKTEEATELLDIRRRIIKDGTNEEGLLGLAFHPRFRGNRQFFVYFTSAERMNVVSRFTVSASDPNRADPDSEEEILRTPQVTGNHNAGTLLFGADGDLYVAVGDGGPVGDPRGNAQNLATVLGKILRIDVDRKDPGLDYAIPPDNPFVGQRNARGEIWAYGLRNVWRMALDRPSGRLWAADVGEDTWEEIDIIRRRGNYGWNFREGFRPFKGIPGGSSPPTPHGGEKFIDPVFAYNHSVGNCIIGGCVYRGKGAPDLAGAYLFADHVTGKLYALRYDEQSGQAISVAQIQPATMPIFSFGEDESGEVYFTTTQGIINRIVSRSQAR